MPRMPGAEWLGEQSPRTPMERYDIVCVHTIVGFAPAHAAHFSTWMDGRIGQSRDTEFRSAANLDGNHRVIAIENEDAAKDVPLTDKQVEACARILVWANRVHGIPLQLCPDSRPGSRGLAYHRQGIDGNFGPPFRFPGRISGGEHWSTSTGKVCPRDVRIAQLPDILARAKQIKKALTDKQEDHMAGYSDWTDADKKALVQDILSADMNREEPLGTPRFQGMTLREAIKEIHSATVDKTIGG